MWQEERYQRIRALLSSLQQVSTDRIVGELGVSRETVRRDLKALDRAGLIRRVHGGALPAGRLDFEPDLATRDAVAATEKDRIARAALDALPAEGTVVMDAGTTVARLAAALPLDTRLTVVTHALPVAARLAEYPDLTLHLVGGRLRHRTRAAVDGWALRAYAEINADVVVIAANGFSPEHGLTTPDLAEAAVKRAMLAAGRRVVLLADSGKFGMRHFARFGDLRQVDLIVTDEGLSPEDARACAEQGPEVVRA